mmetsp:Transcript_14658/g.25967  ORF Transcript_14658/g.25967 Transcript_14658/m.25967 type:complete len:185 (-) Transcript_14658:224-778(-)
MVVPMTCQSNAMLQSTASPTGRRNRRRRQRAAGQNRERATCCQSPCRTVIDTPPKPPADVPAEDGSIVSFAQLSSSKSEATGTFSVNATSATESRPCRVNFNLDATEVHEIVPYAEIYGVHPRDFVFGKNYHLLPAFGHMDVGTAWEIMRSQKVDEAEEEGSGDSEDSDDEEPESQWRVVERAC